MKLPPNFKSYEMDRDIYAFYAPIHGSSSSPLDVQIPFLFPDTPMSKPESFTTGISDGCYINDDACKPSVSKTIAYQNYITLPMEDNKEFKEPEFWHGDRMIVHMLNGDPYRMFISNVEDNSHTC